MVENIQDGPDWPLPLDDDLGRLADDITEIGLLAEETFKNAASALFESDDSAARNALLGDRDCLRMSRVAQQRLLDMQTRYAPTGADLLRVGEFQRVASEYARIADHARQIAEQALALEGLVETHLLRAGGDAPLHLMNLIRQTYIEIRGCILATTMRDTVIARRLLSEDSELDTLFLTYKRLLDHAIQHTPREAHVFQRLLIIGVQLEEIGNRIVSICRALLYAPPQSDA